MRGVVMHGPGDVSVEERERPRIVELTDAIIRVPASCICGSDLWPYRGIGETNGPTPMGHEYVGIVEEVGDAVSTIKFGQFVVKHRLPRTPRPAPPSLGNCQTFRDCRGARIIALILVWNAAYGAIGRETRPAVAMTAPRSTLGAARELAVEVGRPWPGRADMPAGPGEDFDLGWDASATSRVPLGVVLDRYRSIAASR
jgi:Alcohol dehydrogenase GroES-like domain